MYLLLLFLFIYKPVQSSNNNHHVEFVFKTLIHIFSDHFLMSLGQM